MLPRASDVCSMTSRTFLQKLPNSTSRSELFTPGCVTFSMNTMNSSRLRLIVSVFVVLEDDGAERQCSAAAAGRAGCETSDDMSASATGAVIRALGTAPRSTIEEKSSDLDEDAAAKIVLA